MAAVKQHKIDSATVRFAGDSGDGIQVAGSQFSLNTALQGNDLMTFPDFPAEIRAPHGSIGGVSGFQIHFASNDVYTEGDEVDVLVVMNVAAFTKNIHSLKPGGILIANEDGFDDRNLRKIQLKTSPLQDEELESLKQKYNVICIQVSKLNLLALEGFDLSKNIADRCKNFFVLGIILWLFSHEMDTTLEWISDKFKTKQTLIDANQTVLKKGYYFAETSELFGAQYVIPKASIENGLYRSINGATAFSLGFVAAGVKSDLTVFYSGYPITPASEVLHEMSRYKNFNVITFQAEDEIAAACSAIGASYGGRSIGITASSGPGILLKGESINLAVIAELPLVILNAQRAGPSTGLPTKTEQSDLLLTLFGRSGESPIVVLSPSSPGDCFRIGYEAIRIALEFMTPVFILADLYTVMGSEPWRVPSVDTLPSIEDRRIEKYAHLFNEEQKFSPYFRDTESLARMWIEPGLPDYINRIGGLEKDFHTGNVSYEPLNHEKMVHTRAQKIKNVANTIPLQEVLGPKESQVLIISWGSTYGAVRGAMQSLPSNKAIAHVHLRYLNPLPKNLGDILEKYEKILIPELNLGQLAWLLKAQYPTIATRIKSLSKVQGQPFLIKEILESIKNI